MFVSLLRIKGSRARSVELGCENIKTGPAQREEGTIEAMESTEISGEVN